MEIHWPYTIKTGTRQQLTVTQHLHGRRKREENKADQKYLETHSGKGETPGWMENMHGDRQDVLPKTGQDGEAFASIKYILRECFDDMHVK